MFMPQQKQSKQLILTNNKIISTCLSNQYNAYNLMLWLIA